jgi:heat shock protein HtpX
MHGVRNTLKTTILLAGLGGLLVVVGGLFGRGGAIIGLALGLAMVGSSYWFSDKLAIRAARAVPVSEQQMPQYYAIVRELAQKADMPMPKLYVSPEQQPNAFATGRNPRHAAVAVTEGILRVCSWDELKGVLAHELGHVANRDILIGSVAAALAVGITYLAQFLQFAAIFGGFGGRGGDNERQNPLALLATIILAPLAAMLLQMALSRGREYGADRFGARLIGDGEPLARALAKLEAGAQSIPSHVDPAHAQMYIVNPLSGRRMAFRNLFMTHPPTEDRIRRLRSREWSSG